MRILIACERSGKIRDAFIRLGYDAVSCDLMPTRSPGPHIEGDVLEVLGDGWDMMIAHPVCRYLTNAGVRWLYEDSNDCTAEERWIRMRRGVEFYLALRNAPIKYKAIENPIMHCHARDLIQPKNRQVVQPWWFGDKAFKGTGFELIGLPKLVATDKLTPPDPGTDEHKAWSFIHRMAPGPDREEKRSETFPGIASAIASQWGAFLTEQQRMAA